MSEIFETREIVERVTKGYQCNFCGTFSEYETDFWNVHSFSHENTCDLLDEYSDVVGTDVDVVLDSSGIVGHVCWECMKKVFDNFEVKIPFEFL